MQYNVQFIDYLLTLCGPLVLKQTFYYFLISTADRDQTVSRRFKPSSRTILTGEQPDPW